MGKPLCPGDCLDHARAAENDVLQALHLLEQARDCLKRADAPRTLARVRLALSSCKGAARHATGRACSLESAYNREVSPDIDIERVVWSDGRVTRG